MLLDRLRTTRLDAILAVAFTLAGLVQVVLFPIAPRGVGELYVLGSTLPLAWRRTRPVESSLIASAFWLIPLDGYPVLGYPATILQFFALGRRGEPLVAVALTSVWAAVAGVIGTLLGPEPPVAAIGAVIVVAAPVLAGRLVRHLDQQNQALKELTRELQEERIRAEAAAVDAERARIAQELHDVVGHELTLIAIQAEAAASALKVRPGRATEPVEAIRTTAHHTMAEMRAALGVLAPHRARSSSETLVELSDRARSAGIDNTLTVTGAPMPDRAPVSLAVLRIVRECLTNAGRHAPGRAVAIQVDWTPSEVAVRATNPAAGRARRPAGRGLAGIRHRAELLGGSYHLDATGGAFDVQVRIPLAVDGAS